MSRQIWADFDKNGVPTNFYYSADQTTPSAVLLTDDQFAKLCTGQYALVAGALVAHTPAPNQVSPVQIDAERDRRMYGGFLFNGIPYQTDATSISNILGSAQLAFMAIVSGAKAGDFGWAGGSAPFQYIAADNSRQSMDAYSVVAFAKSAAAFRSQIIYAARAAKDALAAGQTVDVTADATWGMDSSSPTSTAKASSASTAPATTPSPS